MTIKILNCDARKLDLPDGSVDLIATSPPYWAQRSYRDGGEHYEGQIGDEATPQEYVKNMVDCMREWARVLKPTGNIWLNLGDKYSSSNGNRGAGLSKKREQAVIRHEETPGMPRKSLIGLPWRVALACMDELDLVLRAEVIWAKPNGLPESVTDRPARTHEQWFHFTKQPKHYSAIDRIRSVLKVSPNQGMTWADRKAGKARTPNPDVGYPYGGGGMRGHVLGTIPRSVWDVPTEGLQVPDHIAHAQCCGGNKRKGCEEGLDHYAAFPLEFPRRIIAGWCPFEVCTVCGEGRRPATNYTEAYGAQRGPGTDRNAANRKAGEGYDLMKGNQSYLPAKSAERVYVGEVCACTPTIKHEGEKQPPRRRNGADVVPGNVARSWAVAPEAATAPGHDPRQNGNFDQIPRTGPWTEYLFDQWDAPSTVPGVVLDPFGGTGTVALVADVMGLDGIHNDLSRDYLFLAEWRMNDPGERARAMRVAKPPRQLPDQEDIFAILLGDEA